MQFKIFVDNYWVGTYKSSILGKLFIITECLWINITLAHNNFQNKNK